MPELPEVETIRRDLEERIIGRKIAAVKIRDEKLGGAGSFARFLVGQKVVSADRIGKLLIFSISGGKYLLVHLKMTGQLVYRDGQKIIAGGHSLGEKSLAQEVSGPLPNKHTRLVISFDGRHQLFFNDLRRFGYAKVVDERELAAIKAKYGIEPLRENFTLENLAKIFKGQRNVKAVLLDQAHVSGIGNIYADEILFAAGISPLRPAHKLKSAEIKKVHAAAEKIIAKAIKYRGTTFSDYVDARGRQGNFVRFLKVYGRKGESCPGCGGPVKRIKVAGRGTHYCPKCQK